MSFPPRIVLVLLAAVGLASKIDDARSAEPVVDYARQVKPILKLRCYACHGALKQRGRLRLDTAASMRKGGDAGPAIEPGRDEESLVVERLTETDPKLRMPPEGSPLDREQIDAIRSWIKQGAAAPADETPESDPKRHWAFVPPVRSAPPKRAEAEHPIDAFLAEARAKRGTTPLSPATPRVLIRRLYLDLTGLPPTPEQVREYLDDPSEAKYAAVVDKLLASPRYGERWARHWMDVWRYSDWYGRRSVPDVLNSYAQIWRWRDWIVRSLNQDRGYDDMVRMMLAADELRPGDDAEAVATGFVVRNFYRWNYNSWMKDNVEHVGKGLLGLTINCAHCHDHKYDPITHTDYFAMRAVFEPLEIRHDRVEGEPDPGPYPKYDYGKAYGPIKSGLVRVFDEKLDAKTYLYTKGESRNIVPGRPPVEPGVPAFLSTSAFKVATVPLPADVAYPGLRSFIRREESETRRNAVAVAEAVTQKAQTELAAAERTLRAATTGIHPNLEPAAFEAVIPFLSARMLLIGAERLGGAWGGYALARAKSRAEEAAAQHAALELAAFKARAAADDAALAGGSPDLNDYRRTASRLEREAAYWKARTDHARAAATVAAARKPADVAKAKTALAAAERTAAKAVKVLTVESTEYSPIGPKYPNASTGRRAALARWITDRGNPLAARVAVNHIWRWHFGSPIVATTHDFGRNGAAPSHPELLDWLAVELMESSVGGKPWSMKSIHKLIVTSQAYRMSSHPDSTSGPNWTNDPENRSYWRFPPRRMEAEEIRDGLLAVSGTLDSTMGGPDVDHAQGLVVRRRSLYFTHHGESRMPFLEMFDAADACDAYKRSNSVVPQQALALVNNDLLLDLSRITAETFAKLDDGAFVDGAFERVLSRPPGPRERTLALEFLGKQAAIVAKGPEAGAAKAIARRDMIHALFSHNDFVTVH